MPYASKSKERKFEGCRNNPGQMKGHCPPKKVLNEFHQAEYHPEKRRDVSMPRAHKPKYH